MIVRGSWSELWRGRELVVFFAVRDLKVRYRQAVLGVAWVLAQPLALVAVFTLVFHNIAQLPSGDIPYPLFALTGLVMWACFSSSVTAASDSLVSNSALVTKVYFARLTAPLSTLVPPLVDLAVSLVVVAAMCAFYGTNPTWRLIGAPLWLLLLTATTMGVGLWLSALNVRYRDVRHAVTPLLQVLLFLSPVAYAGLRDQSDGGRHRGLPLVCAVSAVARMAPTGIGRGRHRVGDLRPLVFPPRRTGLRRCHLATPNASGWNT